ncbi:hypothetical protein TVAG_121770 [Trichomonas vaginalis G3]|uniref:Uncharacterized protein n=1 Tax=Trichomonas vaginalis (strain ATCC PRA-98 / G3) TaxID=412133 RepID=A2E988_TRIV3|nr:hypothetical protein TVAGG3_0421460 [Trichomonas vaginalis G3]EAY10773.1 hypothetical protein TVAG_121770 [Trichomonas vaginalis G3]KAI5536089.1 hypothetical protein TVAGG3_0421460 [Trichomonas vaginalis G3]|eukprot:XP_001322996.1 hypothetical protein [Trichomonas vaginalis G3]
MTFNPEHFGLSEKDKLLTTNVFKRIAGEYGLSTPEVREQVQIATTIFLHYIIDGCVAYHQRDDTEKPVSVKTADIIRTLENSGFITIARKCASQ